MKSHQMRRLFLLSATAGLFASQSVMASPYQNLFHDLDPAPDPDLLALSNEDEAYIQNLFDQFELTSEERSQLLHLIDPAVPGVIEDFDLSREPEAPIPMEEHPEYIELMERIDAMVSTSVISCGEVLAGGGYYVLENDITCTLVNSTDAGIFLGAGAILDLRGHSVTSTNGIGNGIQMDEKTAVFGGLRRGSISGFNNGIYSESNANLVLHVKASNNQTGGINMAPVFSGDGPHDYHDHRVLYSVANNNGAGILFGAQDDGTATGDLRFFDNHVYASVANGNQGGIEMAAFTMDDPSVYKYDSVEIFGNSVSHSRAKDNGGVGIIFLFESFETTDGFSARENRISHNSVSCESTSPCNTAIGGIAFVINNVVDTSAAGINIVDNSIYANRVDNSAEDGIVFEVISIELGTGSIHFNKNHITFNNLERNAAGISTLVLLVPQGSNPVSSIEDNIFAFNRAAYSTQAAMIDADFQIASGSGPGSMSIDDNVFFGNAAYQNAQGGIEFVAVAQGVGAASTFNRNQIFFNQLSSNGAQGVGSVITYLADTAEIHDNRVGFNRVVDNAEAGIELELFAGGSVSGSATVTHNRVDHNMVLDNPEVGIEFGVISEHLDGSAGISYQNRVSKNLVVGNELAGISVVSNSMYEPHQDEKNGVFYNLVADTDGDGIVSGEDPHNKGSNNLVHRNFVAKNTGDGIQVFDIDDVISKNISIFNGDDNLNDLSADGGGPCNTWENNFFGSINAVNPEICFESKA